MIFFFLGIVGIIQILKKISNRENLNKEDYISLPISYPYDNKLASWFWIYIQPFPYHLHDASCIYCSICFIVPGRGLCGQTNQDSGILVALFISIVSLLIAIGLIVSVFIGTYIISKIIYRHIKIISKLHKVSVYIVANLEDPEQARRSNELSILKGDTPYSNKNPLLSRENLLFV